MKIPFRKLYSKKIKPLHFIKTDKAEYIIWNVQPEDSDVAVISEKNSYPILKEYIRRESVCLMGGTAFGSFVQDIVYKTREHIKTNGEHILIDHNIKNETT